MEIERESMTILSWVVGPIQTSIYVVACPRTDQAVIIDAGGESATLLGAIDDRGWELQEIWQTHAHIDHVAGLKEAKEATGVPILMHSLEQPVYDSAVQQGMFFGIPIEPLPPVDQYVEDGQVVNVGELSATVMLLPGHSPGSVAFYFEDEGLFFGGDVLFAGSVGRVDLPGCNPAAMRQSLARVKTLPDDTLVLPGHGPTTTIGEEKKYNPFLQAV